MEAANQTAAYCWSALEPDAPMPLLSRRRVIGQRAMISRIELQKGCVVPAHQHENEQICCVLSGALRFGLPHTGGQTKEIIVSAGEVLVLPPNAPHSAEALEDTVVLDVFSPPSATTGIDRG